MRPFETKQTSTAQALLKHDEHREMEGEEEEEESAGDHLGAGDDGRDPLEPELVARRKSIRKHVRD